MEAENDNYPSIEGFIREEKEGWGGTSESDELECTVFLKEKMVSLKKEVFGEENLVVKRKYCILI